MIVARTDVPAAYFSANAGAKGIGAAQKSYGAWLTIARASKWQQPADVTLAHPKARILKSGRVVFNIKGNDYRLVTIVEYQTGTVAIRFFGTHAEYDKIDAETV